MPARTLDFRGPYVLIEPGDLRHDMLADLMECCPPGQDAESFVADFMERWTVRGEPAACADYLRGYGAWDDDELADHLTNLRRLVWLTACAFNDGEAAYFDRT